jgi:hypothetical protein
MLRLRVDRLRGLLRRRGVLPLLLGLSPAFGGPSTATRPFQAQQRQAAQRTQRATARLPRAPVAAPPIIRNPTPRQTQAAARQISSSITRASGLPVRGGSVSRGGRRSSIRSVLILATGDSGESRALERGAAEADHAGRSGSGC